jgi:hypothetical protein
MESPSRFIFLFAHDLFGKPVSTFPDHALSHRKGSTLAQDRFGGRREFTVIAMQEEARQQLHR